MASTELILSESEWQRFFAFKDYAKHLFDVNISRKDEFYASVSGETNLFPPPSSSQHNIPCSEHSSLAGNDGVCDVGRGSFPRPPSATKSAVSHDGFILRPPPVIVQIETDSKNSIENLEKCKKFAVACNPSNPDYKIVQLHLENQSSVEMVQAHSTDIQQSTATLVSVNPEELVVAIQGHQSCVESAKNKIKMVLHDVNLKPLETENQFHSDHVSPSLDRRSNDNNIQGGEDILASSTTKIVTPSTNDDDLHLYKTSGINNDHFGGIFSTNIISSFPNITKEENAVHSNSSSDPTNPPFQRYREPCESSFPRTPESSSDSEEDNILTDERFKNRIDQASKCGFSDQQIANVLQKLGVNSTMDQMMRELIKEPQEMSDAGITYCKEPVNNGGPLPSKDEDSDDDEDFDVNDSSNLRDIIVDGSNVAMSHGQKIFSCKGIKIVVDWFRSRGHKNITVFVPQWRKEASRPDAPIADQEILSELEQERILVFTPSRRVAGTRIVCYDDRYVLNYAATTDGIVVSNDVYRDLVRERDEFRQVVEKRLLMYSFVKDTFMPPEDPLGRQGPCLDDFLRKKPAKPKHKPQNCPYGKKCTYGNKCRFYHPERRYAPQKMVAEKLKEDAELKLKLSNAGKSGNVSTEKGKRPKQKLSRTVSLIPQEFSGSPDSEDISKKDLLQHSKSFVYSDSYLTELRLKMEQAESADDLQSVNSVTPWRLGSSEQTSAKDMVEVEKTRKSSSPTPTNDSGKGKVRARGSFSPSPEPVLPPRTVPVKSSLNVPNPDERYLSGHVLVAKRLSDEEGKDGNFFSQHTARTPGSLQSQKEPGMSFDNRLSSSDSNASPVSLTAQMNSQPNLYRDNQHLNSLSSQEIYLPPEIPSQVQYDTVSRNGVLSPPNSLLPLDENSFLSPPPNHVFNSFPPTFVSKDGIYHPPPHQTFQRSVSVSASAPSSEYQPTRNMDRKYSLNASNLQPVKNPHVQSRAHQHQVPFNSNNTMHPPYQQQTYKSRVSHDSGINSGLSAGEQNSNLYSPIEVFNSPFTSVSKVSDSAVFSPIQNPVQHMHQQGMVYPSSPFALQCGGNSVHAAGGYHPSSPWQFSPVPSRMPFESPFQDQSAGTMQSSVAPVMSQNSPLYNYQMYSMQIPAHQSQQFQPTYSSNFVNAEHQYYNVTAQNTSGFDNFNSRPVSTVIDEEAPISVEDPRYTIYFNLSSVFGERVVRTFMNRNPDVKTFRELYSLISSYKQDAGM